MNSVKSLSDEELIRNLEGAAVHERGATVQVIALLAEMDVRRLFLEQGYSSLFVYCTKCLHLSEHAAYGRIEAARGAQVPDRLGTTQRWLHHPDHDLPAVESPDA